MAALVSADAPETVVQAQLDAYNAKDIERLLGTYAPEATQLELHGATLATGHDEMRVRFAARFSEPDLHAALVSRCVVGRFVVDVERVTRHFSGAGRGTLDMLCVYEVAAGRIVKASFATGEMRLESNEPPA